MLTSRASFWLTLCLLALGAAAAAPTADDSKDKATTKKSGQTHTVTIKGKKFSPATLTIKVGDTVVWKNEDDHDHTVNAADKSFKSGNISADETFKHTFSKAGTFQYACQYHPREKATIKVEK
jgi:plastocyanin